MNQPTSSQRVVVKDIGGFHLVKELGQGGMGKVFLARQASLDRMVALKVLQPDLADDAEFVARFHREARAAALFQHPNITAVIDAGQDPRSGVHFIAFEFLSGGSLEDTLKKHGTLKEEQLLHVLKGCVAGLHFAETKGLVHRDIKPDNILFDAHMTPKLADLGLARRYDANDASKAVTQTGVVLGTPVYMAPEQALGEKELDIRVDIYSLGLCAWRCLAGVVPFDEDRTASALQILSRHINQDLVDIRKRRPETSDRMALLIQGMTARARESRYSSAGLLAKDLERVIAGHKPQGPAGDPAIHTTRVDAQPVVLDLAEAAPPSSGVQNSQVSAAKERRASGRGPQRTSSSASQKIALAAKRGPSVGVAVAVLVGALALGIGLAVSLGKRTPPAPPASPDVAVSPLTSPEGPVSPSPPATTTPQQSPQPQQSPPLTLPDPDHPPRPVGSPPRHARGEDPPAFVSQALALRAAFLGDMPAFPAKLAAQRAFFERVGPSWPEQPRQAGRAVIELGELLAELFGPDVDPTTTAWKTAAAGLGPHWQQAFPKHEAPFGEVEEGDREAGLARLKNAVELLGHLGQSTPTTIEGLHGLLVVDAARVILLHTVYRFASMVRSQTKRTTLARLGTPLAQDEVTEPFWAHLAPHLLRAITAWPELPQADRDRGPTLLKQLERFQRTAIGRLLRIDLLQAHLILERLVDTGDQSVCGPWLSALKALRDRGIEPRPGDLLSTWISSEPLDPVRGCLIAVDGAPTTARPIDLVLAPQRVLRHQGPRPTIRLTGSQAIWAVDTQLMGFHKQSHADFTAGSGLVLVELRPNRTVLLVAFDRDASSASAHQELTLSRPQRGFRRLFIPSGPHGPLTLSTPESVKSVVYVLAPREESGDPGDPGDTTTDRPRLGPGGQRDDSRRPHPPNGGPGRGGPGGS